MKKRALRRLLAGLLTVVMLLGVFPTAALADLLDNSPAMNREILARLAEVVDSEDEAARYYEILQQYGLLDEDGSEVKSWDIYFNGEKVTLDDLRGLLADPDCDLEQYLIVDGTILTLGEVKTMLEIENYIAYLRETYFTGHRWSREQLASLQSLVNQINTQGIQLYSAEEEDAESIPWPSVSHAARVSVSGPKVSGTKATFTATLTGVIAGQKVSFGYEALSGSQTAKGSGTVTFKSGETSKTFTVDLPKMSPDDEKNPIRSTAGLAYYVKLDNIQNALFDGGREAVTLTGTADKTTKEMPTGSFNMGLWAAQSPDASQTFNFTKTQKLALDWGLSSKAEVNYDPGNLYKKVSETEYELLDTHWLVKLNNSLTLTGKYSATFKDLNSQSSEIRGNKDESKSKDNLKPEDTPWGYVKAGGEHDWNIYRWGSGGWRRSGKMSDTIYFTLEFSDHRAPSVVGVTAPAGAYYPGQTVPVRVSFDEPVQTEGAKASINGEEVSAAEQNGASNVLTFPYVVKEADGTGVLVSSISVNDTSGNKMKDETSRTMSGVTLVTPIKSHAIAAVAAQVEKGGSSDVLTVMVSVLDNEGVTNWLNNDLETVEGGSFQTKTLKVMVDGNRDALTPLTVVDVAAGLTGGLSANVPIPLNTGTSDAVHVVELVLEGELLLGKYATAAQKVARFVTADDIELTLTARKPDGSAYADGEIIYPQDEPTLKASYTLKDQGGYAFESEDQFVWSSSDPTIANIDQDGVITPTGTGSGTVGFTLTALNGGIEGKEVSKTTGSLNFGVGLAPFLLIPNNTSRIVGGQSLTIYWSSNLCDKNGDTPTLFTINAVRSNSAQPSFTTTLSGTAAKPVASVTIPGSVLAYDYDDPIGNTVTVTVSAVYEGVEYTAQATVTLDSQPAVVSFDELKGYYITDQTKSLKIGWTIRNFERFSGDGQLFQMLVTKGNTDLAPINDPGTEQGAGTGVYTGSYTLNISDVVTSKSDPASYREVYTVTIQAKNGADSTWSHDSFMLYVYDADALKIMVDGAAVTDATMSNIPAISQMSQAEILALKRDIYLKNIISVNYGQYAWKEVADQIAWSCSNDDVATVNYQQGSLYENIKNFTYAAYRPTIELGLSGISDGEALVKAVHALTGMETNLNVRVETLKDQLYLFQVYPQVTTTLTYTNGDGEEKTVTSDDTGAAAIYEAGGIVSDVHCRAQVDDVTYLGTLHLDNLKTGEGDWTKLERYPLNNLTMRRAAYANLYIKDPDGKPYVGEITFRGGVYVNGDYKSTAHFGLNGGVVELKGDEDQKLTLGADGKLTVTMDQTEWELPDGEVTAGDKVRYVFEVATGDQTYYPMLVDIDSTVNQDAFVGSGEAIVNFRKNTAEGKHPFIAMQTLSYTDYPIPANLLDETGRIGPNDSLTEANVTTTVLWWGEDMTGLTPTLQLTADGGVPVANGEGEYTLDPIAYPFTRDLVTQYTVRLNADTLNGVVNPGESVGLALNYYKDGATLSRHESIPFHLTNLLGVGKAEDAQSISDLLSNMGSFSGADAKDAKGMDFGDAFVGIALDLVASDNYTDSKDGKFSIKLAPTSDATKFLGFIHVKVGNMPDKELSMGWDSDEDFEYMPGLSELMVLVGKKTTDEYLEDLEDGGPDKFFGLSGYMECLVYFDFNKGSWEIQILNGGFDVGGGLEFSWDWNTMAGPIPFTASLAIGGTADVSMDALSVAYYNETQDKNGLGNDFLTELRIYLYLRFFAGVGIDYAVVAFKLGIYGQIQLDMRFQWLNRPYMDKTSDHIINTADGRSNQDSEHNLSGQHFQIDGQIGLEFVARILFISYSKTLWSYGFNLLNRGTNDWDAIQTSWAANQAAQQQAISGLLNTRALSVTRIGGQQMLTLNLAPTLESRDYLATNDRTWGPEISPFAPDQPSGLASMENNTYPYANPVVTDDGAVVVYLSDMGSADVEDTRVAFATKAGASYEPKGAIDDGGYGDSQVALAGTENFAVAAWTRHTVSVNKDAGATLTDDDQMILMNGADIYVGVYRGGTWTTVPLVEGNANADLAPVVATNGSRAIAAWRSVASGVDTDSNGDSYNAITNFNEKDTILYRIYNGQSWGETETLYNGTSGQVKGIVAAMMADGTAAVAYTLDTDGNDTLTDRETYYAVIGAQSGQVVRNVRATRDNYLDENPQLAVVHFPNDPDSHDQHFVLGWYSEHPADANLSGVVNAAQGSGDAVSDIRLVEFNNEGITEQLLPDSISQVAADYSVSITPTFRFTKNASTINDLSILWVERAKGTVEKMDGGDGNSVTSEPTPDQQTGSTKVERDVLKGVKFYTYGQSDQISFTGAVDVAEMGEGTLIDHFDAYVSNPETNEVKAVILGSTYGANGETETKEGETVDGTKVTYTVPKRVTSMYTATETYADKIRVPAVLAEYDTVRLGALTHIMFTVENAGIHAVNALTFNVGGIQTEYTGLNILPGKSVQLYADYYVPLEGVVDPDYIVTADFNQSVGANGVARETRTATGTIYLDRPDLEITQAKIVEEVNGQRTIQLKLNNASHATLTAPDRSVQLGFYTDVSCETPVYGLDPITITDSDDLTLLDEGGYSIQVTFDVKEYLEAIAQAEGKNDAAAIEIPDKGIQIYIKAEVLEDDQVMGEPIFSNNYANVTVENLYVRTGKHVSVTSDFETDPAENRLTVTVTLQNNHLTAGNDGEVMVRLLDQNGEVLFEVESRHWEKGIFSLPGEGKETDTFTILFDEEELAEGLSPSDVASIEVIYIDNIFAEDNSDPLELTVSGEGLGDVTLDSFTEDPNNPGVYRSAVEANAALLSEATVTALAESALTKLAVRSGDNVFTDVGFIHASVPLTRGGETTITVTAVSGDGTVTKTYILTIQDSTAADNDADDDGDTFYGGGASGGGKTPEPVETPASQLFDDAEKDSWYEPSVTFVVSRGLFLGTGKRVFSPKSNMTRAMLMTVVARLDGQDTEGGAAWYEKGVAWAVEAGISDGTNGDADITREQMVTMLYRYAKAEADRGDLGAFADAGSVSDWARDAMIWAVGAGVINGVSDPYLGTILSPAATITREEVATILQRFVELTK